MEITRIKEKKSLHTFKDSTVHQGFGVIDTINIVVEENKSPLQHLYIEGFNDVAQQFGDADFRKS